jgi:hypothetical protein
MEKDQSSALYKHFAHLQYEIIPKVLPFQIGCKFMLLNLELSRRFQCMHNETSLQMVSKDA